MRSPRGWRVTPALREALQRPHGELTDLEELRGMDQASLVTVGDVVSLTAWEEGIRPRISVYDGMTERREMTRFAAMIRDSGEEVLTVGNPAGTITRELLGALGNALENKGRTNIRVEGEEDLATLACMLLAPDGMEIVYGLPGRGMMRLTSTAETRARAEELWNQLEELE